MCYTINKMMQNGAPHPTCALYAHHSNRASPTYDLNCAPLMHHLNCVLLKLCTSPV